MRLKIKQLQRAVKITVNENKATSVLKNEITRVFGPIINTDVHIIELARSVNERVNVITRAGRTYGVIKPSALLNLMNHKSSDVRKMVALLIPESFLHKLANDKNMLVLEAVARRAPFKVVKSIVKSNPLNYNVIDTYRERLLEAKATLKSSDDKYVPLGEPVRALDVPDLTDEWYNDVATDMIDMYGRGPEYGWEEKAVIGYCRHTKATNGVEVDYDKLLKAVFDISDAKDDKIISLKEIAARLRYEDSVDELNETVIMPALPEEVYDPVVELYESNNIGEHSYVEKFSKIFNVKKTFLPEKFKRQRILEGYNTKILIPCVATMPFNEKLVEKHEIAIDKFVKSWNKINRTQQLELSWAQNPGSISKVNFFVSQR